MPVPGTWDEVLNSDAAVYGGSGVGNLGSIRTEPVEHNGFTHSARITLPPLGAVVFTPSSLRLEDTE